MVDASSSSGERERLTTVGGLAALSLDALSSAAYGPEAILVVLVAAGAGAVGYALPVTVAIVVLLAALVISYRQVIEAEDKYHRLVVLIPEVHPARPWLSLLHNQRGAILDRAIRRGTSNVVLCRLRFRLEAISA